MQLVMHYVAGDGFTYSCDVNLPFEYESAEAALVDFELGVKAAYFAQREFRFAGWTLNATDFFAHNHGEQSWRDAKLYLPEIWTVEDWFANLPPS